MNRQWCEMTGIPFEQALQSQWSKGLHPDDRVQVLASWQATVREGLPWRLEFRFQRPDGTIVWVFTQALPEPRESEEILGYVGTITDITEAKHREAESKQAEQKIREQADLLNITSEAIFVRDLSNHIIFWNQGAQRLYGWTASEILGQHISMLFYQKSMTQADEIFQAVIEQGEWQGELRRINKVGEEITVATRCNLVRDESGQPRSILTVDTNITETKRMEAQFLRVQRLESLGTMASGIAHDFNNLLTPILAITQLLPLKLPHLDEKNQNLLKIVEDNVKRGADLVKQIMVFARGGEGKRVPLQISPLLSEIVQMARHTFPKDIDIQANPPTVNLWTVFADATQLHQVLMNLAVNARDAMPNGGILRFSAENIILDETFARMNLEANPGSYVVITVMDTGSGIPAELLERIFDPFLTTKEVGKGTGLGLSTTLGIVKKHEGFVKVYSQVGHGSQFKVYLPTMSSEVTRKAEEPMLLSGRNELILIVEDEPSIQQVTQTSLEICNYRTLTASDGIEAISLYTEHMHEISLVLMDMMMPLMDGASAIRILQSLNPRVKVIAMSGLSTNSQVTESTGSGVEAFLPKPYTVKELLHTLRRVLG